MSQSRLKIELNKAIIKYLAMDNREPNENAGFFARAAAAAISMYQHVGTKERLNAQRYQSYVLGSKEVDSVLILNVMKDIESNKSCLEGDIKIRLRLLQGLCAHYEIKLVSINEETKKIQSSILDGVRHSGGQACVIMPSDEELSKRAMLHLLASHIDPLKQAAKLEAARQENRSSVSDCAL